MSLTKALDQYLEIIEKLDLEENENFENELEDIKDYVYKNIDNSLTILKEGLIDSRISFLKSKIEDLKKMVKALENKKKYFEYITAEAIKLTKGYHTYTDRYTERVYYVYPELSVTNEVNKETVNELYGICGRIVIELDPEDYQVFKDNLPELYEKLKSQDRVKLDVKVTDIKQSEILNKERYLITKFENKVKFRKTLKKEE